MFQPVGILGAVLALAVWIPAFLIQKRYILGNSIFNGYPAALHSEQIFALFVLPLLTFFVLRREGASGTGRAPLYFFIGQVLLFPLSLLPERMPFYILFAACAISLAAYAYNQAKTRANMAAIHPIALLLGTALVVQAAAAVLLLFTVSAAQGGGLHRLGRLYLFYGVMPPAMAALGLAARETPADKSDGTRAYILLAVFAGTLVWDLGAFLLGKYGPAPGGELLRLLAFAFVLPRFFPPRAWAARGARGFVVLAALVFALAGLAGRLLDSVHGAHLAHFYFVGGVSLLLVLAGDGFAWSRGENTTAKIGWAVAVLIILAALTRATAHFWPRILYSHLLYAAIIHITALGLWWWLLRRDWKTEG